MSSTAPTTNGVSSAENAEPVVPEKTEATTQNTVDPMLTKTNGNAPKAEYDEEDEDIGKTDSVKEEGEDDFVPEVLDDEEIDPRN